MSGLHLAQSAPIICFATQSWLQQHGTRAEQAMQTKNSTIKMSQNESKYFSQIQRSVSRITHTHTHRQCTAHKQVPPLSTTASHHKNPFRLKPFGQRHDKTRSVLLKFSDCSGHDNSSCNRLGFGRELIEQMPQMDTNGSHAAS